MTKTDFNPTTEPYFRLNISSNTMFPNKKAYFKGTTDESSLKEATSIPIDSADEPQRLLGQFKVYGEPGKQWLNIHAQRHDKIRLSHSAEYSTEQMGIHDLGYLDLPSTNELLYTQQRLLCTKTQVNLKVEPAGPSNLHLIRLEDSIVHFKPGYFFASGNGVHFANSSKKALSDYRLARRYLYGSSFGEGCVCLASSSKLTAIAVTDQLSLPITSVIAFSDKVRLIPEHRSNQTPSSALVCKLVGQGTVWVPRALLEQKNHPGLEQNKHLELQIHACISECELEEPSDV